MAEKLLCAMAGYDNDTSARVAALYESLVREGYTGTQTKDIPYHITLGTFAPEEESEALERVRKAALEAKAFDVSLSHIGVFSGSKVLFITPDINRELLALREQFGESPGWVAHTTLLIDEPKQIYGALPIACAGFQAFRARVTALHLYAFWPARHIATFSLAQE